jgi:hypothetical protein
MVYEESGPRQWGECVDEGSGSCTRKVDIVWNVNDGRVCRCDAPALAQWGRPMSTEWIVRCTYRPVHGSPYTRMCCGYGEVIREDSPGVGKYNETESHERPKYGVRHS